jgi:hypothetical protein
MHSVLVHRKRFHSYDHLFVTDAKVSTGNNRAAYMRVYRKRKRLEEYNCNNLPKRTKLHAELQREYRETHKNVFAEYMHNYRKRKAQENTTPQVSTSSDPTPTPIIYNCNQANEYFQKIFFLVIHFVIPATYVTESGT